MTLESGLVHSVVGTAANVADITQVDKLLHGDENVVYADAGYTGVEKRPEHACSALVRHAEHAGQNGRCRWDERPQGPKPRDTPSLGLRKPDRCQQ